VQAVHIRLHAEEWVKLLIGNMKDREIFVILIIVAYLARLLLIPFYILTPYIPHDFYVYVGPGKCMAEGKFPRYDCASWFAEKTDRPSVYGPLFSSLMMVWYSIFGDYDFVMLKVLVSVFDVLNVLLMYMIGRNFFSKKKSFFIALLYCFSFIVLYNSAVLGNDEVIAMAFVLSAVYFLMKGKFKLSALSWAASIMFKTVGIIIFPAICYYVYRRYGIKKGLIYFVFSTVFFLLIALPFYLAGGLNGAVYHIIGSPTALQGSSEPYSSTMSFYNIFRYVTNKNINSLAVPLMAVSYIATLAIILLKKLKNPEMEFFRNAALLWIVILAFGSLLVGTYVYYFFPFLIIFLGFGIKKDVLITKQFATGAFLIFISLLVYSVVYREGLVEYSFTDRILLLLAMALAPLGAYNLFHSFGANYRILWSVIILATIMSVEVYAAPLLVFPLKSISGMIDTNKFTAINELYGDHIQGRTDVFLAYGIFYGGSAVLLWICLCSLYYTLLKERKIYTEG